MKVSTILWPFTCSTRYVFHKDSSSYFLHGVRPISNIIGQFYNYNRFCSVLGTFTEGVPSGVARWLDL